MKKKKVNLPRLALQKEVISYLSQEKITGGAPTIIRTCTGSCQPSIDCTQPTLRGNSCIIWCKD
ncbi:hypothetical protein [Chitinophaga varians]|uniref:hypothetical protein n=1 Tax=Chitinophaga varians TaxID=2202339 RepID=UPI00165F0B68|nr:hypothetical protein [Chitinophaga varians]MBC9910303.1 hypothetical protein [Chitinophaga varians]